jgi:dihydropyrimidinase/dihydroorotase
MVKIAIKNGRVVAPSGVIYGGVAIDGERIIYVGSDYSLPEARKTIDAEGCFVIPGLIDPHVHMGGAPGIPFEEELYRQLKKETEGALRGVTTFGNMITAGPGGSNFDFLDTLIKAGQELSYVDFFCHGVVASELHLSEQPELWRRGVTSFKHFWNAYKGADGMGLLAPTDEAIAYRSLLFVAEQGYPGVALFHCEEIDPFYALSQKLREEGRNDLEAWAEARPPWAEEKRIFDAMEMAKNAGNPPVYIVHISCAEGVNLVAEARRQGYPVWGETNPAFLTHTCKMDELGCWGKVIPPFRYPKDRDRLWRGMRDGGITNIGTDLCAWTRKVKEEGLGGKGKYGNLWDAAPGLCGGLEHLLPVMMTFGVHAGKISIEEMVRLCSTNTAKVFGIYPKKGVLAPGSDADIVIVDPYKEVVVDDAFYHCGAEFSVYHGWKFKGLARTTIIRGEVMMEDYETTGKPGHGRFIARGGY